MDNQNFDIFRIRFLAILLLLVSSIHCFAQKPEKRNPGNRKPTEGRNNDPGKSTRQEISDGNLILGTPTANSITVSLILKKEYEAIIEYAPVDSHKKKKTATLKSSDGEPIEIILNGLSSNTLYTCCLKYCLPTEKEFRQTQQTYFSTQRKFGSTFSFGVQGDSHPEREGKMFNPVLYRQTLDSVAAKRPDFYFMMGDDFSIDRLLTSNKADKENVEQAYLAQRSFLGNSGNMPPLFLINGNHEQSAKYFLDGTEKSIAVIAANARKKYFPLPDPIGFYGGDKDTVRHIGYLKDYYSFEWGNALFVTIDPYWHSDIPVDNQPGTQEKKNRKDPWSITLGDEQYNWLKNTLEKSKAKYKFVFSHHVLGTGRGGVELSKQFEWGGYDRNGTWQFDQFRPEWPLPIHQLMVRNKVTIFFQGHDHLFAKQELDGVVYQSVPNPADDTYTAFNRDAYTSGVVMPNSGFIHVTVSKNEVKVDYVRSYFKEASSLPEEAKSKYSYRIR